MSDRLRLAVENGHVVLPEGRLLVVNARPGHDLSLLDQNKALLWTRSAAEGAALQLKGWHLGNPSEAYAGAIVFLPRARMAQKASLQMATLFTTGPVIVDGNKTDGVDAFYKTVRKRAEVTPAYSKAHGKVFSVNKCEIADWPSMDIEQGEDGWWRAPGVFSGDGVDKASAYLAEKLPASIAGCVIDLGAGWGYLSEAILSRDGVTRLFGIEDDLLAYRAAIRNVTDKRASFHHADALSWQPPVLADHVITNPPFHTDRAADPALGQAFIRASAAMLKPKGNLWLVANRQLPYESTLEGAFRTVRLIDDNASFKIFNASQPHTPRKG